MTLLNTVVLFLSMDITKIKEIVKAAVEEAVVDCGSQVALAEKAGISQGAIGKYLRREALPTGVTANNLSAAVEFRISRERFAPHIFANQESVNVA